MGGLVAVIGKAGPSVAPDEIAAFVKDYEHFRPGVEARQERCAERVRAATFGDEVEAPTVDRPPSWLLVDGWLHLPGSAPATIETATSAEGQYVAVGYDSERDRVVVINDPFGMYSLYLAETDTRAYVSTSSLALARHLHLGANRLGVQAFLVSGYQFGTRTHWNGMRRLDPGTSVTFSRSRVEERPYWRPVLDRTVSRLSFRDAVCHGIEVAKDAYASAFSSSVPRWVDLTGGYDSRLMSLLLEAAGVEFAANTRTAATPDDVDIAKEIADVRGWEWWNPDLPATWQEQLPGLLRPSLGWGDAQLEVLQLSRVLWAHAQLGRTRPRLLSAGGGEHFQYYGWQSEFLRAGRSSNANVERWIDMIALKPAAVSVLTKDAVPEVRGDFKRRFEGWMEPYRQELNTTQLEMLYLYKCTGHFGAYRTADSGSILAQLPFYMRTIFTSAISTNWRWRNGHRLMRGMVDQLDSRVARIRTTRGGPAQPWRPWRAHKYLPYFQIVGRKGVNKVSAALLGSPLLPVNDSHDWQLRANSNVLSFAAETGLLEWEQMRLAPVLDRAVLDNMLGSATAIGFRDTAMLGRIITAEMALRETDANL